MRRAILLLTTGALLLGAGPENAATHSVEISAGFAYRPEGLRIAPGDTVTWDAGESHPLAFDAGGGPFVAPQQRVLGAPGAVLFYCTAHGGPGGQGMSGIVTIGDGNAAPTVTLRRDTAEPRAGEPVVLVADARDPERIALRLDWDVDGDGGFERTDAGATASGVFGPGTHTVSVRATDDLGLVATASVSVAIPGAPAPPPGPPPAAASPPAAPPPPAGGAPPPAAPAPPDATPPRLRVRVPARIGADALRSRGLAVAVTAAEDGRVVVELRNARGRLLARGARQVGAGRRVRVRLHVRDARAGRLVLRVIAADVAGNRRVVRRGLVVARDR